MPTKLIWSNQARIDLMDIYVLIGLEQPAAAERYFDRIEQKAQLLQSQPRMGVRRPDVRPGLRMLVEIPYLLLYRTDPDTDEGVVNTVEIVRVLDGRRDLGKTVLKVLLGDSSNPPSQLQDGGSLSALPSQSNPGYALAIVYAGHNEVLGGLKLMSTLSDRERAERHRKGSERPIPRTVATLEARSRSLPPPGR